MCKRGPWTARRFPEVDRAEWYTLDLARDEIVKGEALFSIARNKTCGRSYRSGK
ncbi:MAG: hypothetical protein ACREC9_10140 [Methylocella sp.]